MRNPISHTGKLAAIFILVSAIAGTLASAGIMVYESSLLKSIMEKFKSFYSHARQDRLYVQTDKTFYKPGETIWFTAYVRDAETLKASENSGIIHIELITPKGTTERHYKIVARDGAARGDFDLSGHPGGLYKIRAYTEWQKNDTSALQFEKEITVQSVVMPRLKMKLDFEKKAYGKGDEVVAKLELNTNAGKPLGNTAVKFKAQLDGKELSTNNAITDADGKVNLRFSLPADLNTVDGVVNAMIDFEGSTEAISRSIPIVLNKIKLEFFPEGGDMVCNENSQVAFRATNEFGKPADVEGIIVDSKGQFVNKFSSFHFGMGAVDLIPKTRETYRARITKPEGILDEFNLPEPLEVGYVLSIAAQSNDAIHLSIQSFEPEELSYIAQTRGKIYSAGSFKAVKGANEVSINATGFPMGISQITLFDSKGIERCERLVFVHKNKQLKITVSSDKPQYKPREQVNMNIRVTDEKGLPVPGNFSLAVVDDNLLSFADDKQGNILSKMLLEPELKEKVEEPNFYFDAKEAKADKALDLLLMTSGWRRYTWKQIVDGDYPGAVHAAEKAEISGTVYDQRTKKPLGGAVVKIVGTSEAVITDGDGNFYLKYRDIPSGILAEIDAPYYREQTRTINNYGKFVFYLISAGVPLGTNEPVFDKMNYQAVIRDVSGRPLPENRRISIRFKIHAGSASGKVIFEEMDTAATNKYGLINTYIGQKKINDRSSWETDGKYLEVDIDPLGGNNYKKLETTELTSVPYALFANNGKDATTKPEVAITSYKVPLVDPSNTSSKNTVAIEEKPTVVVTGSKYEKKLSEETVTLAVQGASGVPVDNKAEIRTKMIAGQAQMQAPAAAKAEPAVYNPSKDLAQMDLGQKAPDLADMHDLQGDPNTKGMIEEVVAGKAEDARANAFIAFNKRVDAQRNPVTFYRAKEFPTPKYSAEDTARNDFASTVYWNGNVIIDHTGRAKISFTTNDLISSFKATLEGFGDDGSVGRAEYNFTTNLPFAMDAKIPVELVSGDKTEIPVFLKNSTPDVINGKLEIASLKQLQLQSGTDGIVLPANSSKVVYITATATSEIGEGDLGIKFISEKYHDAINRKINVVAKGFPANISLSGQDMNKEFTIRPENVVPGSMKISFSAYPNIMSELMSGVASILREPNGCFEQTSSSNYPNILALEYLKTMDVKDPVLEKRAKDLLDKGYKKLTGFETKENGYEWFGAAPAHEALTAYGLMEFEDMKKVYGGVDQQMVDRTANLLLGRRDGEGGFKKNPRALDSFGKADDDVTNAYIVYALSEAGYKDNFKEELDEVYKSAKKSEDPYIMALCTNALFNVGDKTRGEELLTHLLNAKSEGGYWTGKKHSITRSTGESLKVETTALVLMAMMKSQNPDNAAITGAVKFLVGARSGYGGFGSTQATIMALKSLTRYAEYSRQTDEAGTVEIYVNGLPAGNRDYSKGERNNITIDGLEKYIGDGKQKVEVRFNNCKQALPYAMNISYSTTAPESAKECVVGIDTKLSSTEAKVGETVRLTATVTNKTNQGQPMTMAIIGLPAGCSAQPWQLKEMQEKGTIDFYEITGNNIAFYYRDMAPNAVKQINLDLKAEIPGEYDAPASSAYLYYTNELKSWEGLQKVTVKGI